MIFYTVHESPEPPSDRMDRADELKFVPDGLAKSAFVLGPLWLLSKRSWLALAAYSAAVAAVAGIVTGLGLAPEWIMLCVLGFHLMIAFEGASLERLALERDGWRMVGTVSGKSLDECERRFLEGWLPGQRMASEGLQAAPAVGMRLAGAADGASEGRLGRARAGFMNWRRR